MSHIVAGEPMDAVQSEAVMVRRPVVSSMTDKLCDALAGMRRSEEAQTLPPLPPARLVECAQSKLVCASLLVGSPDDFDELVVEAVSLLLLASVRANEAGEGRPC